MGLFMSKEIYSPHRKGKKYFGHSNSIHICTEFYALKLYLM